MNTSLSISHQHLRRKIRKTSSQVWSSLWTEMTQFLFRMCNLNNGLFSKVRSRWKRNGKEMNYAKSTTEVFLYL